MGGGENPKRRRVCSSLLSSLFILVTISILITSTVSADDDSSSASPSAAPAAATTSGPISYTPPDSYLLNCGSPHDTKLDDGRTFQSDSATAAYLQTSEEVKVSVDSIPSSVLGSASSAISPSALPLFRSARIFTSVSKFTLPITRPGRHWLRLYFYPLPNPHCTPSTAVFSVATATSLLLHDFSVEENSPPVFKEYLLDVTADQFALFFNPRTSCAFLNALELVSVPDGLIPDEASPVPGAAFKGLSKFAFQVSYRLNVGGPIITPADDALTRTWTVDTPYNDFPQGAKNVSVSPDTIKFPMSSGPAAATPYIAPSLVYATADQMADSETQTQNFNLTWKVPADSGFSYLIRLHFCDIVSKSLDSLYFNVYINGFTAGDSPVDLSSIDRALSTAYYKDFVVSGPSISNDSFLIQVGPDTQMQSGTMNAILNGIEVMKMSRTDGSLDGIVGVGGFMGRGALKVITGIGLGMAVTGLLLLGLIMVRWHNRPKGWEKRKSFSSWLLPLHGSTQFSVSSSKSSSRKSSTSFFSSRKSKSYSSPHFSNPALGRYFSFAELQTATQNFDEAAILGVGGFGKVYLGVLEDGTKVAIKRGIPGSEQGINEFQTEIQLLSKLRHRHLVSLIGFSDEQSEMILVYEYMANGPLRDHLYGKAKQGTMSWKQRLEICIGSARGLHYLHTGASEAIIHRDVKTTNILLDEKLVAKVADFGLSKAAPTDRGPVSTAVKGSFGYLDPEYFRRQQLTDKSDVYSFGVLLFEVLCARPVICPTLPREQVNLAEWAMRCYNKGTLEGIIDKEIKESIHSESLNKFVEAAEKCLAEYGVDRPAMGDVLWNLEYALQLQDAAGVDPADERSTVNLIAFESGGGKGSDDVEKGECGAQVGGVDDSQVIESSTIISHFGNVQGR
ncbi:unnamed protein product [Linum trigynum]|uniref:Protein kinase domain-containing protein n=1 Tax=Linum trigynum TaxID=586398 RepID=A0AAV2GM71_9ROSI